VSDSGTPAALCFNCGTPLVRDSRFCTACGSKHTEKEIIAEHARAGDKPMQWPLLQYGLLLLFCTIVRFAKLESTPMSMFMVDILLAAIIIAFSFTEISTLKEVFIVRRFNVMLLLAILVGAVLTAIGVNWLAGQMERMAGEYYTMYMFQNSPYPVLLSLISTAVFPGFFEELAFRGVLFTQMRRVLSATGTILVTAIAFAILHLSPLSLIWLLPIGLITGYLRHKTGTIWYGVALHFTYNSAIVLLYFWTK
jgi:membrane protease YdiL (CAAX protease family)